MEPDPFDDVLNLEDQFYEEGYQEGVADGTQAGRIEGRSVGLGKGFDKFFESGRLYGKALVWANRLPESHSSTNEPANETSKSTKDSETPPTTSCKLPPLPSNPRLEKNITSILALVEPDTLSTANTDEAVSDFDDRVKQAQGKVKIVDRTVGESQRRKVQ